MNLPTAGAVGRVLLGTLGSLVILVTIPISGALQARAWERQVGQDPQQTPPTSAPAVQPALGQAMAQAEFDEYKVFETQPDPKTKAELGEQFLLKYPDSGLRANVHRHLMFAYQQLNDAENCILNAEHYLTIVPQDIEVISVLAFIYAESRSYEEAAIRANRANLLLETFVPPISITSEQWAGVRANLQSMNYSTLGYCDLQRGQAESDDEGKRAAFESAIANFNKALQLNPQDDYSYYRVGMAYAFLNRLDQAFNALAKASVLGGLASAIARGELERMYKLTHQDSLEGLDDVIAKATQELRRDSTPPPR